MLQAAGYRVKIAQPDNKSDSRPPCCGRTYFSNGMINQAREEARRLLAALLPYVESGLPVVGMEPSCILSLRDEYLKLNLGDSSQKLADKVFLFEEFIAQEQSAGRWTLSFDSAAKLPSLLIHGHCHQKAVGAIKAMRKALKQVPGLQFELIESSCCGVAGNFGLEAEHYAHARAMAELSLFPALRAKPDSAIVCNGFSCQQQIANAGFAKPLHLTECLCKALSINPIESVSDAP